MFVKTAVLTMILSGAVTLHVWAQDLDVSLTVEEPVGVERQYAPVTSGICLPRGRFPENQHFSLFDGDTEIPLQTTPLVVERDGSLRWVLLDFQLNIGPNEAKQLTLLAQPNHVKPKTTIQVTETQNSVTINTGPLMFVVSKTKPFTIFDTVSANGKPIVTEGVLEYVDAKTGERYIAGIPQKTSLEYSGPLRVTVRVDGTYEGDGDCQLKYITRITAWAGHSDVRVQHILANSNGEQVYHVNLKSASLTLRHALGVGAEAIAGVEDVATKLSDGQTIWMHQGKVNRYNDEPIQDAGTAGVGGETKWTGSDSGGWLAVRNASSALLVCDRDFLGDPPRKLMADKDYITLEFVSEKFKEGRGVPFHSDHLWLYDLSHRVADVWINFAASSNFGAQALASRQRLMAFAPGEWYARCNVFGVGQFGTLEDEKKAYQEWGWKFDEEQIPRRQTDPHAFVRWEDNHRQSEADSAEALLLMAIRTGQRGFFDQGEAWARYHANLHAWRTDGWVYDDGAIWFAGGGPQGTRLKRKAANVTYQARNRESGDDRELWHLVQGKACYCHFYGAGLVDYFFLTGERDALEAAMDLAEQKNSELRRHRKYTPGETTINSTRGFGRGFYVIVHLLEAMPENEFLTDLARLCRDTLWQCPNLDERGFAPNHTGAGFGGFNPERSLPEEMKAFMDREGIRIDEKSWLTDKEGKRWPVLSIGGTWEHTYAQAAADRYAWLFDDEDMADFTDGFGRFAAKYLMSKKCKQVQYRTFIDVPIRDQLWDPWQYVPPHTKTQDGEGCEHSGWYTRFYPDVMAKAYSLTGDHTLLVRAREFWHYGSKRGYRTMNISKGWDAIGAFANHIPPKEDSVLSTSRTFYEWAHPRPDSNPPQPIRDLSVVELENGRAMVRFTTPADIGGGKVVRYQVKCAELPIVAYDEYDFARDDGIKRNFWRATNVQGEPLPSEPGTAEQFIVSGVPSAGQLYFVVVSYDDSSNRSALSNMALSGN